VYEIALVIADLYVAEEATAEGVPLPGLEHVARFGKRAGILGGWRAWLARRVRPPGENSDVALARPATIAAIGQLVNQQRQPPALTLWLATPVHLITGLTSLHLDRRGVLRLPPEESATLAGDFQRTFHDSGFALHPLLTGEFLLSGPSIPAGKSSEPARSMGENLGLSTSGSDTGAPALRRLGAEIEMWLHDHALNDARRRRGELPVTGLWLWGGGPPPHNIRVPPASGDTSDVFFGHDAYVQGLCASIGANVLDLPAELSPVFRYARAQRAMLVIEISPVLHSNPQWSFFEALGYIDRNFIVPALAALNRGALRQVVIVANDRELTVRAGDRFRFWRSAARGLSALQ
jgi:hypothetical protein